jgi:hypothetical protein
MSALGQKRTLRGEFAMSALLPKADVAEHDQDVRFVPKADISSVWKVTERRAQAAARRNG